VELESRVYKLVIAGDGGIGKTTLTKVFCNNEYLDQIMTIGVDLHSKVAYLKGVKQDLQIWDLSGQTQFRFMLEDFVRMANGVILGFDCTNVQSFLNLLEWFELIRSIEPDAPIYLIATKRDRDYHLALNAERAMQFVSDHKLLGFSETSAKDYLNVDIPFRRLFEHINQLPVNSSALVFKGEEQERFIHTPFTPLKALNATKTEPVTSLEALNQSKAAQQLPSNLCPHCKTPLRASQIKLKQSGKKILCHNCLNLV
jgi:small GTP-binding protein